MTADPDQAHDSPFSSVITALLDAAHHVEPARLPDLIRSSAVALGATSSRVWLADHQQRTLVPLDSSGDVEAAAIDRTVAGRAFVSREPVEVCGEGEVRI